MVQVGCKLMLFTNRKSDTGFRLLEKSVTSNNLEWYDDH